MLQSALGQLIRACFTASYNACVLWVPLVCWRLHDRCQGQHRRTGLCEPSAGPLESSKAWGCRVCDLRHLSAVHLADAVLEQQPLEPGWRLHQSLPSRGRVDCRQVVVPAVDLTHESTLGTCFQAPLFFIATKRNTMKGTVKAYWNAWTASCWMQDGQGPSRSRWWQSHCSYMAPQHLIRRRK